MKATKVACPECGFQISSLKSVMWIRIAGHEELLNVDGQLYMGSAPLGRDDIDVNVMYKCPKCDCEFTTGNLIKQFGVAGILDEDQEGKLLRVLRQAFDEAGKSDDD